MPRCIEAADRAERERLLRYCARPPFALERLPQLDGEQLSYDHRQSGPGGSGPQILTPLKLLDRLAAVVPPLRVHRHRYFGVLAPNSPRRSALTALALVATTSPPAPSPEPTAELAHRRAARYAWARLLARIYGSFPTRVLPRWRRNAHHPPSSPTARPCATSSSTSANRPRHPGSHPPAARRYRGLPDAGPGTFDPQPAPEYEFDQRLTR